jgi:hypothetical protein
VKLLRTIRLDPSDGFVFEPAAQPGEWAVVGSFMFWDENPAGFTGKQRSAFRSGWLGVSSMGWSTLAVVQEASEADVEAATHALADGLVRHHGAPDRETALPAAREEIAFAASLADHPAQTIIALHRTLESDGRVRETFRTLMPGKPVSQVRAFSFVAEDDDAMPEEQVDLAGLLRKRT